MDKKQSKEALAKLLKKYNFDSSAVWDCRGTPVLLHKACEQIAIVEGIRFERPAVVESNTEKGIVVVVVEGELGDKREWSFGECGPKNNKNGYPYAMAEKRAKDRVILKLIGMSGYLFSEDEADDFQKSRPMAAENEPAGRKSSAQAKRDGDYESLKAEMEQTSTTDELREWGIANRSRINALPRAFSDPIRDVYANQMDALRAKLGEDT